MNERAVLFGADRRLVGVVTCPPAPTRRTTGVILFNAGVVHRVGPNRLYVELARRLSARGFTVLRFDHSGLGDSPPRDDRLDFARTTLLEAIEAMNCLEAEQQCTRFVLVGLCSGTLTAFRAAQEDVRVVSLVLLTALLQDPSTVPEEIVAEATNRRVARSYLTEKAVSGRGWRKLLAGNVDLRRIWRVIRRVVPASTSRARALPGVAEVATQMERLLKRGVSVFLVYPEPTTLLEYFRMTVAPQLRRFRRHGAIELTILRRADHTFTELHNQERVVDLVGTWVTQRCS